MITLFIYVLSIIVSIYFGVIIGTYLVDRSTPSISDSCLEVTEYNPKKDILAIFVGNEDCIPSYENMEEIRKVLDNIPACKLLIAPGIFRFVVLKGVKEKKNG